MRTRKPQTSSSQDKKRRIAQSGGGQPYRLAIWNSHIMAVVVVTLLISNIVLGILLVMAYPLKRVEPMLITSHAKEGVHVQVTPLDPSVKGYDILLESMVRQYIHKRESIDLVADLERWNDVKSLSKPAVWKPFYETVMGSRETYNTRMKDAVTRQVLIRNISRLDKDLFQIEWEATDRRLREVLQTSTWVSILRFTTDTSSVEEKDRYLNPLGFFVTGYSITRKDHR